MTGGILPISLPLCQASWGPQPESFSFAIEPLWSLSLCNILSDERMNLSVMNRLHFCQVYVSHIEHVVEYNTSVSPGSAKQIMSILLMLQQQLRYLNGCKLNHSQVKDSYVFYVWCCLVLCCEHVYSHDFVWLLLVACTILLHTSIHMEGWKPYANHWLVCTLENFQWYGESCFASPAVLRVRCLPLILRWDKCKPLLIWSVLHGGLL
jgi:hypothetical protein